MPELGEQAAANSRVIVMLAAWMTDSGTAARKVCLFEQTPVCVSFQPGRCTVAPLLPQTVQRPF
jgi:hypothetical protein